LHIVSPLYIYICMGGEEDDMDDDDDEDSQMDEYQSEEANL
jgi:hypothetical protein